ARRRARHPLQRRPQGFRSAGSDTCARKARDGAVICGSLPLQPEHNHQRTRSTAMKRLSLRLFALGLALGSLVAAAVPAAGAYALTTQPDAMKVPGPMKHARRTKESGQPVIDWNQILLSIVNTAGAQPANIQPTRNLAILHAAIYDAVNSIDRTQEPYLISVRAPRDASETAAADAAAHAALIGLYPAQQISLDSDYAAELAQVPNGPAKDKGIR